MSYIGKELSSLLKESNEIFHKNIRDEYKINNQLADVTSEIGNIVDSWYKDWVLYLRGCISSDDLHDKAFVLNFFNYNVHLPDDLDDFNSFWDIPVIHFEHIKDVDINKYITDAKLENPLNYHRPIVNSYFEETERLENLDVLEKYFKDKSDISLMIHFQLLMLALMPIRNDNLMLLSTTEVVDWVVRLTREMLDSLRYYCLCEEEGYEKKNKTFDRNEHLKLARKSKTDHPRLFKQKVWELFESGKYGTVKKQAALSMINDLKQYMDENDYKFWPESYIEFVYNKILCRKKI